MAFTNTIEQSVSVSGEVYSKSFNKSGGVRLRVDEPVANSETDKEIVFSLDVSATKMFYLASDQSVTLETNDGSSAANTINLIADVPYVWHDQSYDTFKLTTDVTSIFITNASGSTANIRIEAIVDPTP